MFQDVWWGFRRMDEVIVTQFVSRYRYPDYLDVPLLKRYGPGYVNVIWRNFAECREHAHASRRLIAAVRRRMEVLL